MSNAETFDGSNLEEIWNYFLKTELKLVLMYSCLKHIPELIINSTNASRKIKSNKNKIFDMAVKDDNAEVIATLFSQYKTIKLDELNEYIEKANDTVAIKAFFLDYNIYMQLFFSKTPRFFSDLAILIGVYYSFFLYFSVQNKSHLSIILQVIDF